jgi:YHS domain-containing protein
MRRLALGMVLIAIAAGCHQAPQRRAPSTSSEFRTIESADPRPAVVEPPPMLGDEAAAPKPKNPVEAQNAIPLTEKDEEVRAALPFAPAIAMDPVDGSKISIRADTPMLEFKGHFFYFHSTENRATFQANPDQYAKAMRL